MRRERNAKIVATLGPASASPEMLQKLFAAGVDVFRINFSHGERSAHADICKAIRELEREYERPIAVLQDLQGPKIRLGRLPGGERHVKAGEVLSFSSSCTTSREEIPLPHEEVFRSLSVGQEFLIDDGRIRLQVEHVSQDRASARVNVGGVLKECKGVNIPGGVLGICSLTEKDRRDIALALELGIDWIALSFLQSASDVAEARALVGSRAGLIAKIEMPAALSNIGEIIDQADGVMIARGDLGVEIPLEDVPSWQKDIIQQCRSAAKPVIVATQMLESMISNPTPSRAEATDVATAIYDGADAVMLSAESAVGRYPVEAVNIMDKVIRRTEGHRSYKSIVAAGSYDYRLMAEQVIPRNAAEIADQLGAGAIAALTFTGATAARISRCRPTVPILALTPSESVARKLCLLWGVHSVLSNDVDSYEEMIQRAAEIVIREGFAVGNTQVVVVGGIPFKEAGSTNNLRILRVPDPAAAAMPDHRYEI